MPPRKVPSSSGLETKEPLTAVVLADSFTQRFRPVTVERPKVLLPLVNTPMLDYTLEWLAINAVEEVFVFCCAHADQIEAHLSAAGWTSSSSFSSSGLYKKFKIHVVVSTNCLSMGDAMRLLDQRDIIKNDFILVAGDVITNVKLQPVLAAHRHRRNADKTSIMTMLMRGGMSEGHRKRLGDGGLTVMIDPTTGRLVKIEEPEKQTSGGGGGSILKRRPLRVDCHLFGERDDVQVRTDLLETSIYICAPEVLMLFSDNFDYQNLRRDFVTGVLSEEELGNKLFVHEITKEYAFRVHNLRSYDAISKDILSRWTYPLVPDTNLFFNVVVSGGDGKGGKPQRTAYKAGRSQVYMNMPVTVARTATISRDCCIASGCTIGSNTVLEGCVVGNNCTIGSDVVLRDCYLHNGVVVGDGARVESSLLCDGVVVKEDAVVEAGCVLSYKVVIDTATHIPPYTQLSLTIPHPSSMGDSEDELEVPPTHSGIGISGTTDSTACGTGGFSDDDSDGGGCEGPSTAAILAARTVASGGIPEVDVDFHTHIVGPLGAGYVWEISSDKDEVERYGLPVPSHGFMSGMGDVWDEEEGSDTEVGLTAEDSMQGGLAAPGSAGSAGHHVTADQHFKREVAETFLRCVRENISHENVVIELNGLKIAEDKTFADCARYMMTTMLGLCLPPPPHTLPEYLPLYSTTDLDMSQKEAKTELLKRATAEIKKWKDLLERFLRNEDDQVELLLTIEEFCGAEGDYEYTGERGDAYAVVFAQLLKVLYDEDVVSEESILQWAEEKEHADEDDKVYLRAAAPFLEWLENASEEESDDDEEEDDSEEE